MVDFLISRVGPGVSLIRSTDPFGSIKIFRIQRANWKETPEKPGIYLLYGVVADAKLTAYVGMSTTNMRARIHSHHINAEKNWFGALFAVPVPTPLLCPAIEAELIERMDEAGVVDVIDNKAHGHLHLGADDAHVEPAVERIVEGLQLVLGSDIFTAADQEDIHVPEPHERLKPLSRENRGAASEPRFREENAPKDATHGWAGGDLRAYGCFLGSEPEKRFRVWAESEWRWARVNWATVTAEAQSKVKQRQDGLVKASVLESKTMTFAKDHVFDNWSVAAQTIRGRAATSGAYHWQRLKSVDQ